VKARLLSIWLKA